MELIKPTVTMKYVNISNFEFAQAVQKIAQTPVTNKTACAIRRVTKELNLAREIISKDYQDKIVEVFGKRDEKGELIRPKDQPAGFDVDEAKQPEFLKAQEAFGENTVELKCAPLDSDMLGDIKLSAWELEKLGSLFSDTESK